MTRRGVFSTIAGFIVGLFGTARAKSWQSSWMELTPGPTKEFRKFIIRYTTVGGEEYPNMLNAEESIVTTDPKIIEFMDNILMKVYINREPRFIWKNNVHIEYAPGQYVESPWLTEGVREYIIRKNNT